MKLSDDQISAYHENGFLLIENIFGKEEIDLALTEMDKIIGEDSPRRILEKTGAVRSFFCPELTNHVYKQITLSGKLVNPSRQLLGGDVYIHQSKINSKHAMVGDWWEWHQDYTFWKQDDGMPCSNVLTAMVYLNDVNEFNGPLILIPGSHKAGIVDDAANDAGPQAMESEWFKSYQGSTTYMSALTANLKYTLKQTTISKWVEKRGIYSAKGPAGSVLFFHGNIFHASSNNLTPWNRHAFLVTYNSVHNTLPQQEDPRPSFLANRDFTPIAAMDDHR